MRILLAHALRSEAGLIKQFYPRAKRIPGLEPVELIRLSDRFDILRTGIGLANTDNALRQIPNPKSYTSIIHFGVSGSLSEALGIGQIIQGQQFLSAGSASLELPLASEDKPSSLKQVTFLSSHDPITDEDSRQAAVSLGAAAVDMESYSVAAFCLNLELPLLAIRCISDRAGDSTPEDFKQHYQEAANKLQKYLLQHYHISSKGT